MTTPRRKRFLFLLALAGAGVALWLVLPSRRAVPSPMPSPVAEKTSKPASAAEPAKAESASLATNSIPTPAAMIPPTTSSNRSAVLAAGTRPPDVGAASPPPAEPTATLATPTPEPGVVSPEAVGTARMYAAHAPLRVKEIADPDSAANRQILQTMVNKALSRAAANPAPTPSR